MVKVYSTFSYADLARSFERHLEINLNKFTIGIINEIEYRFVNRSHKQGNGRCYRPLTSWNGRHNHTCNNVQIKVREMDNVIIN